MAAPEQSAPSESAAAWAVGHKVTYPAGRGGRGKAVIVNLTETHADLRTPTGRVVRRLVANLQRDEATAQ